MKPRPVYANALQRAIQGSRLLSAADVSLQIGIGRHALDSLKRADRCFESWRDLADLANMAETLAGMGLGGGADAVAVIDKAQGALADLWDRQKERKTWTMRSEEIDAFEWLLTLHRVQLEACSYRELERAINRTKERMAQALAGNAGGGVRVMGAMA